MKRAFLAFTLVALAACDGPQEQTGEVADNAAGAVSSEDAIESGPRETLGERRDEANDSAEDARDARADALEDAADEKREAADQQADALDNEAARARGR